MKKVAHYRRSVWLTDNTNSLEEMLVDRFDSIPANVAPKFNLSDGQSCMLARRSNRSSSVFLHFVTYSEGSPVAVIETRLQQANINAAEQDPDGDNEYIISQLFCVVRGNDILWITHNEAARQSAILKIFRSFLVSSGADESECNFDFLVVLDEQVVQNAINSGVGEIDLNLGALRPTLDRVSRGGVIPEEGLLGALSSFWTGSATSDQLDAAERINGKFVFTAGRSWDSPNIKDLMVTLSNGIRNHFEDEFTIVTKSGVRLTHEKMSLTVDCQIEGNRRVLNSIEVERELREALNKLDEDDVLSS